MSSQIKSASQAAVQSFQFNKQPKAQPNFGLLFLSFFSSTPYVCFGTRTTGDFMHPGYRTLVLNTSMCLFSYISLTLANDRYFQYQLFDY